MARPNEKVEIGFDLTGNNVGPYFRLDDPIAGILDNVNYFLGGTIFYDVTDKVIGFSIKRGKSRQLDRFPTGQASITFDNNSRDFDPTYAGSPYRGQIIPRREVRITSGTAIQYLGSVDDWNLNYEPNADNTANAVCSDGFRILANQSISPLANTAQYSGDRISAILDLEEVNWPPDRRDIDAGHQYLGADTLNDSVNALQYLQTVEQSEPGSLFVSKQGKLTFRDRLVAATSNAIVLADDGSGIPYQGMQVVYGSELLYNYIEVASVITGSTAIAGDSASQNEYGIIALSQTNLLMATNGAAQELANWYAKLYSTPEFRFESVELILNNLSESQQNQILDLELGSVVKIVFTPGNPKVSPAIEKYAEVIRIDNIVDAFTHKISLGFATLDTTFLVLDDVVFGRLDSGTLGL